MNGTESRWDERWAAVGMAGSVLVPKEVGWAKGTVKVINPEIDQKCDPKWLSLDIELMYMDFYVRGHHGDYNQ